MCIRSCLWPEVKSMASVTAVSIERHAGDRLRMSDLRGVLAALSFLCVVWLLHVGVDVTEGSVCVRVEKRYEGGGAVV